MRIDLPPGDALHEPYRRERSRRACPVDWGAVEPDYRSGCLSLRDMARKHGCSHSAIANFAGKHGWKRENPAGTKCVPSCRHDAKPLPAKGKGWWAL